MFIGHFGVALAAKKLTPSVRLGTLLLAAQFLDFLWPILLVTGLEKVAIVPGITVVNPLDFTSYPISHSLLAVIGWALLFGFAYYMWHRSPKCSFVLGILVVSHWVLDLIVHRPDLPIMPNSPARYGLGLWNSLSATVAVEGALFVLGVGLYLSATRTRDRIGNWALWLFIIVLGGIYAANLFGPPPPDTKIIGWAALALWLFVPWAYWIDRHRRALGDSSR
ncbi:MAG: hypothetical protein HZB43_09205 [candidate division Zixibacteria bacterium]|nr:hypothetical protein [candidate division Zixibacteria bacterium]